MKPLSRAQRGNLQTQILDASVKCSERCLYQSAKWAAELASALPPQEPDEDVTEPNSPVEAPLPASSHPYPQVYIPNPDPREARLEAQELPRYLLAKSFFDCREFLRCAAVFLPEDTPRMPLASLASSPNVTNRSPLRDKGKGKAKETGARIKISGLPELSQKALFLALYAKYMAGEKHKDEESEVVLGPADTGAVVNQELVDISRLLEDYLDEHGHGGGWLEYLHGIFMARSKNDEAAKMWLMRSVKLNPFNWGAWEELNGLIGGTEELQQLTLQLPQNLMSILFHVYASQECQQANDQVFGSLSGLDTIFPQSLFLKTQRALLEYHQKDYDSSQSTFNTILTLAPHRLDSLDVYSHILHVRSQRSTLSYLANLATTIDPFRPETNCIVGNYYSLSSQHEKSANYFRRALTLDRSFFAAWTLLGHEYVELKNTHAAIESYRRAVDGNRKDFQAWYGLGQTYEILEMYGYALWYFQRAAALSPGRATVWLAIGTCLDRMDKFGPAIRAMKRALMCASGAEIGASFASTDSTEGALDPDILLKIADIYVRMKHEGEAVSWMELCLAQEEALVEGGDDEEGVMMGPTKETSKARLWLAKWEFRNGDEVRALRLANELCNDGYEVEEAQGLLRDLKARRESD